MAVKPDRISLALIDQDGRKFGVEQLAGRLSLTYFGFLHCRVVCPRTLAKLGEIMRLLGQKRDQFRVLYISVDPERDTPDAMKAFLEDHYPDFTGLSGERTAIDDAKASLKVFTRRIEDAADPQGYAVPHTALIYLIDEEGRYMAHFGEHLDAAAIFEQLARMTDAGSA